MSSQDRAQLFEVALSSYFGVLDSIAEYIEASTNLEVKGGIKPDPSEMWTSPEIIDLLEKKLGAKRLADLAISLLRLSSISSVDLLKSTPDERLKVAQTLREISSTLRVITKDLMADLK